MVSATDLQQALPQVDTPTREALMAEADKNKDKVISADEFRCGVCACVCACVCVRVCVRACRCLLCTDEEKHAPSFTGTNSGARCAVRVHV